MKRISRREFLRAAAAGMGLLAIEQFLAACGNQELPPASTEPLPAQGKAADPTVSRIAVEATETAVPEASSSLDPTTPPTGPSIPDLVVARGGEPEEMVYRAIAALGGMQAYVSKGAEVVIKPNICVAYHPYEYAATTNPFVVAALVKLCLEAGAAHVRVLDGPFGGTAQEAYSISGIQEQVQAAGGEMVVMSRLRYKEVKIPGAGKLKKVKVFDDLMKADLIIDVPIAKHHNLAGLTLGMKNLMGVIQNRSALHADLGQNLADLTSLLRPRLTIIDAVRILTANGPTGGNLDDVLKLDTLVASSDIVAADSYAATLFGMRPEELGTIRAGVAMGLGRSDLGNLKIEEIAVGG